MKYPFFNQLQNLSERYITVDMDHFAFDQVSADISTINQMLDGTANNDEFQHINDLLSRIVPHLYVARGFASNEIPRKLEYYSNIQECKNLFRQIVRALE